ncbi:MAG: DNA polymerase III subunit alpha [Pseudomonadales bacterium]
MNFVHLRVHSEYSIADSIIKVKDLAKAVAERDMAALALTDLRNLFGLIKFYKACIERGVKPVIGVDITYEVASTDRDSADVFRLGLLAMNETGYRNLLKLVSEAYLSSGPRGVLTREQIFGRNEGLIALSAGRDGEVGRALLKGNASLAETAARQWAQVFEDRYYLELSRTGRAGDDAQVAAAVRLALAIDLPVVATNEVCFLDADQFEAHETRVCIHDGRVLDDPRRERRYSAEQYLKSPAQMVELFHDVPEALTNSVEIAKRCNVRIELGTYYLPNYPVPDDSTLENYLASCARSGLESRLRKLTEFGELKFPRTDYDARLDYELSVINQMGFPGYFLIVMEFIAWAKANEIPVGPGRGSGAGSLVAYALGITDLDPLRYELLFERFLNPERVSMPDFDVDFCMEGRDKVINHVSERYGSEAVSQIITFGTMAAKAVVRDVARVQGKPYGLADKLSKLIPFEVGMTLHKAVAQTPELRDFIADNDEVEEIMDMAYILEGIVRGVGRHAGGVVIAPRALTEFVPLYVDEQSGGLVSQFDKDDVESAGLVKFDFLGLKTLTVIDWTVKAINEASDRDEPEVDIERIPLDDPATYELLKEGRTTGIFQLESHGMKDLICRLKPDCIDDIIALVALFRPGPLQSGAVDDYINRKHGNQAVQLPHPSTAAALQGTYGVMLYQEQVMQIAQDMCGFSLGQADLLRRAMGKKKPEEMAQVREQFVEGARARDVDLRITGKIFDDMEKFSGYAFNKSHSSTYAIVSFQTAWLKCHHPAQFMAATLTADMHNTDKIVTLVDEVGSLKLRLQPPSVNLSQFRFIAVDSGILYGLGAVRGVGEGPVSALVASRERDGPFHSLADFCLRVDSRKANKRVLEALIRAGAMDEFAVADEGVDGVRARLLSELHDAMQGADQVAHNTAAGIADMFGGFTRGSVTAGREVLPLEKRERLEGEKEALGIYLTGHPIEDYLTELRQFCSSDIASLRAERRPQIVAGWIVSLRTMRSRRGDTMAIVVVDDRSGRIEALLFADTFEAHRQKVVKDTVLVFEGEVQDDDVSGNLRLRVENAYTIEEARRRFSSGVLIDLCANTQMADVAAQLRTCLQPHRHEDSGAQVAVVYQTTDDQGLGASGKILLGPAWRVNPTDDLLRDLRAEFGADSVCLDYAAR